jgi:acetyl-CoA synthetase
VLFEGVPTRPDAGRCWQIVDKLKVTIFYTAPTAIRALHAKVTRAWWRWGGTISGYDMETLAHCIKIPYTSILPYFHTQGDAFVTKYQRSSLRLLGSVGGPINPGTDLV